jgi:crotonobetainyl-CoA:carnitine CoA-transferase CaiB-like acyl-CoA transferase
MAGPLSHIKVLDLSRVLAGPWSTQILGDMGAEVIKIERPGVGDDTRAWGPPFQKNPDGTNGDAAYFHATNRNKISRSIDITTNAGQQEIKKLAIECDILVENYKVGGLKKYGLDYESLSAINPKLIYCSITGFGQTGPYALRAGYDFMIQAMGGMMSITGERDENGGGPQKVGVAIADVMTGMYATVGILGALAHRDKIGEGQYIDIALLDTQIAMLANHTSNYLLSDNIPKRLGNEHFSIVPYQTFKTTNGDLVLAVGNDKQFASF